MFRCRPIDEFCAPRRARAPSSQVESPKVASPLRARPCQALSMKAEQRMHEAEQKKRSAMPVYEYLCSFCGPFTVMRPMAESALPSDCPECGASAPRVLLTAPHISGLSAARRRAHAANERSAHAPRTAAEFKAELAERRARHGRGCACCSGTGKTSLRLAARDKDGMKSFPTKRPWMISH